MSVLTNTLGPLNFSTAELQEANKQKEIMETVVDVEELMDQYLTLYYAIPPELRSALEKVCSQITDQIPLQTKGDSGKLSLDEMYRPALNSRPHFYTIVSDAAGNMNGKLKMGPIKSPLRTQEKAEKDYNGDFTKAVDIVRASIVFPSMEYLIDCSSVQRIKDENRSGEKWI
jgi:hypothetical protein